MPSTCVLLQVDTVIDVTFALAFGALFVGVLVLGHLHDRALYGGGSGPPPEDLTNCPDCGSRVPADRHDCEYCGSALPGEGRVGRK